VPSLPVEEAGPAAEVVGSGEEATQGVERVRERMKEGTGETGA
jgi:hypothetical protein